MIASKRQSEFGIATDGITWVFFKVRKFSNYHRAYRVLQFRIDEHDKLAQSVFKRLGIGSIKNFLRAMATIHEDMTPQEFDSLMNLSFADRLAHLAHKAVKNEEKKDSQVASGDEKVLRELYSGACLPVSLFQQLDTTKPINITGVG